jgi:hypothetical protein
MQNNWWPLRRPKMGSHELADLIQAGKVVKGPREGRVVPYFLVKPVPPAYSQ